MGFVDSKKKLLTSKKVVDKKNCCQKKKLLPEKKIVDRKKVVDRKKSLNVIVIVEYDFCFLNVKYFVECDFVSWL